MSESIKSVVPSVFILHPDMTHVIIHDKIIQSMWSLITIYRGERYINRRSNDYISIHTHDQAVVNKTEEELDKRREKIYIKCIGSINRNKTIFLLFHVPETYVIHPCSSPPDFSIKNGKILNREDCYQIAHLGFLTDNEQTEQPSSVRQCSNLLLVGILGPIINTSVFSEFSIKKLIQK